MKIRLTKYILSILAITFVITSCSKSDDVILSVVSTKQDILTFKTVEEFNTTVQKVNSMKPEERSAWEKSKGFKSFGTICDEFYATINPDKFKSTEEALSFINSNSSYLEIVNHSDSSKCCEKKEFRNPARFVMNENKMYIVGNSVYKQFDEGCVTSTIANIETLKAVKDFNIIRSNSTFVIKSLTSNAPIQKVTTTNVGNSFFDWDEQWGYKGYKYRLEIYLQTNPQFTQVYDDFQQKWIVTETFRNTSCNIRNYKRVSGIWWYIQRLVTYNIVLNTSDNFNIGLNYTHSGTNVVMDSWFAPWPLYFMSGGYINEVPFFTHVYYYAKNDEACTVEHTY